MNEQPNESREATPTDSANDAAANWSPEAEAALRSPARAYARAALRFCQAQSPNDPEAGEPGGTPVDSDPPPPRPDGAGNLADP